MRNSILSYITFLVFCLMLLAMAVFTPLVHAAEVYFTVRQTNIYEGDTFVVEANLSSPDELINVADGSILYSNDKLAGKDLSTGGSIFSIWAEQPSFSDENGRIKLVGGVPEGFRKDSGLMLKAVFLAQELGKVEFGFSEDFSLFLSDGLGTKIDPDKQTIIISVLKRPAGVAPKNEWEIVIANDTIPPEPFEALIAKDSALFDNRYFVSFFTTDKDSGLAYYEIKEGGRNFVRAESPYLLQDQSLEDLIQIKAVDKAGNERVVVAVRSTPEQYHEKYLFWLIGVLAGFIILFVIWRTVKTKHNEA